MREFQHICFFPGTFAPPTKDHLNAAFWLESKREVSQVIVVVGTDESDKLSVDQKYDMWKIYLKSAYSTNIRLEKSDDKGALTYVYNLLLKSPDSKCFIAVDKETAQNKAFMEHFDKFPNYEIQLLPSQFEDKSKKMLDAVKSGEEKVFDTFLPGDLPEQSKKLCYDILKEKQVEEVVVNEWYNGTLNEMFDKYKTIKFKSIYQSGEYLEILKETEIFGKLYESDINLTDVYDYTLDSEGSKVIYSFMSKYGDKHVLEYHPKETYLKIYLIDPKTGKQSTDREILPKHDNKIINTYAKIMLDEILSKYNKLTLLPLDGIRYRFFRAIFAKNLNKQEWNIDTNNSDSIIISKK